MSLRICISTSIQMMPKLLLYSIINTTTETTRRETLVHVDACTWCIGKWKKPALSLSGNRQLNEVIRGKLTFYWYLNLFWVEYSMLLLPIWKIWFSHFPCSKTVHTFLQPVILFLRGLMPMIYLNKHKGQSYLWQHFFSL